MANEVMERVWDYSQHKGSALLLLVTIANNVNHACEGYPGIPYLATRTRMSERQVQRIIQDLEASGELVVIRLKGRDRSSLYFVLTGLDDQQRKHVLAHIDKVRKAISSKYKDPYKPIQDEKGDILSPFSPEENKGDILSPFPEDDFEKGDTQGKKGDIFETKGDTQGKKGDIAMSPEPINQLTTNEPLKDSFPNSSSKPVTDPVSIWSELSLTLEGSLPRSYFVTWVQNAQPISFENGLLVIGVANKTARSILDARIGPACNRLIPGIVSLPAARVRFEVAEAPVRGRP